MIDRVWTLTAVLLRGGAPDPKPLVCAVIDRKIATETNGEEGRRHVSVTTLPCALQHSQAFYPDGHLTSGEPDSTGSWTAQDATHNPRAGPEVATLLL
jgi:hypothetical protein